MAYPDGQKSSADLEREVQAQRNRVEARIGEIKDRLSPGQIVDELLSYTKDGGGKFMSNLGQQVTANPLPTALLGVGLVWLMTSNMRGDQQVASPEPWPDYDDEYPYATVSSGGLRRVSHAADEQGVWWSEFESDTGERYRAQSDSLGKRAGHFVDSAGKKFAGFIDSTGHRVKDFRDEAGNKLDDATSWANHNWQNAQRGLRQGLQGAASMAGRAREGLMSGTRQLGGTVQQQTDELSRQAMQLFEQQPLIAGALAFAAGAALGAALPHTKQEDELIGAQAAKVRQKAREKAGELYQQGKEKAAELYDEATSKTSQLYEQTKDNVANVASSPGGSSMSRH